MITEILLASVGIFVVLIVISVLVSAPYANDDNDDQIM
jgi:hypothetical protein